MTPDVSVVAPGGGEVIDLGQARIRILEDGTTTAHRLGIAEITIPAHTQGPPQHRHAQHDEGFYVVSGTARFTVGRDVHEAPAGTLVMVPPGAPHTFANPGDQPLVMINTFTPDLYVQYFRDLRDMITGGRAMTAQNIAEVMDRYATTAVPDADGPLATPTIEQKEANPMTVSAPTGTTRTIELHHGPSVTVQEFGEHRHGTGVLMLHGGAGPRSMAGFAAGMSQHAHVLVPTHPGFDGTPRPEGTDTVADLACAYLDLLDELGLDEVMVVGSSAGGWIAAEMALRDNRGRISALVLLGATGITPEPPLAIADPADLGPVRTGELAFHNPDLRPNPAALSDQQKAAMAANRRTLAVYAGDPFCHDPKLRGRLHRVGVPVLVLAGEQDGIVPLEYERALADSFPRATFRPIPEAGHFPHLEQPDAVFGAIGDFVATELKPEGN
ncbi:alpha/beta fold hydrolase [Kitasatospora acidiphila]|uniref:Alpha/beta fold hydrolase n=2 Tax=Kitasatospora acidiphila TaxID=2567942 RepID=A0A540VYW1_9ACTN|nr:alpha/beta fold hydrolase [Kitasatospora acidiphila]